MLWFFPTSQSRVNKDHSISMAVMGCTACALRMSAAETSDKPMHFTNPFFTIS